MAENQLNQSQVVSTHSRAEAAAKKFIKSTKRITCFNTQPRGGGCLSQIILRLIKSMFQHTAARRRLPMVLAAITH